MLVVFLKDVTFQKEALLVEELILYQIDLWALYQGPETDAHLSFLQKTVRINIFEVTIVF